MTRTEKTNLENLQFSLQSLFDVITNYLADQDKINRAELMEYAVRVNMYLDELKKTFPREDLRIELTYQKSLINKFSHHANTKNKGNG